MSIIVSAKAGGDYKPCPEGVHDAVCVFVEDIGFEHSDLYNKDIHKVVICWEVNEPMSDGRPFMMSQTYTASLSDKAKLRKDLEGWRGKKFTDEELKGFDLEILRGKQCQLQIIHNEKGGKTYANIQTVLPKGKHSPAMSIVNTEVPAWIIEKREANRKRQEELEGAPVVVTGLDETPRKPSPNSPVDDEPPF